MPRKSTCSACGVPIAVNKTSRERATCRACRWAEHHAAHTPSAERYRAGCRCRRCTEANAIACRELRTCGMCGVLFEPTDRTKVARYCSAECRLDRRREMASTRRALMRGAFVERVIPSEIHRRDKWTCHICGRKLSPHHVFPHRRAATLDHLVPLSKGGLHEPANVRTACNACNAGRCNRGGNEQLLLIG